MELRKHDLGGLGYFPFRLTTFVYSLGGQKFEFQNLFFSKLEGLFQNHKSKLYWACLYSFVAISILYIESNYGREN